MLLYLSVEVVEIVIYPFALLEFKHLLKLHLLAEDCAA